MKKVVVWLMISLCLMTGCSRNVKKGVQLLEAEKYEDAVVVFKEQVQKKRNLDESYSGLGIAYFELKEYELASEAFLSAIENDTKDTGIVYSFLAACYVEMEEYELALEAYEQALAQEDITEELIQEAQFNLIAVYEKMGNWDAAKNQMETYVEKYPEDSRVDKEAEFLETR